MREAALSGLGRPVTRPPTEPPGVSAEAWSEFRSGLSAYVRRRVDPASVDDVVGHVLLRLVANQEALRAAGNTSAWMRRVAANAVADHHRRRDVERRALDAFRAEAPAGEAQTGGEPGQESNADAALEISNCLKAFIRGLPAPYGEALLLTDIEGLTQAEAAKRLGLSLSGMKSRVQRGRAKLKQALLRCCVIETDRWGTLLDYRRRPGRDDGPGGC